jgi:hypothetical protein
VQKPDLLTTFSWSDGTNNTNLNINDLTPASDGQDIPAKGGQGHGSSSNLGINAQYLIVNNYLINRHIS